GVRTRLVLEQGVRTESSFHRPFHLRDEPNTRESFLSAALADVVDHGAGSILIEESIAQVRICPLTQIELADPQFCGGIAPYRPQLLNVFLAAPRIAAVDRLLVAFESSP